MRRRLALSLLVAWLGTGCGDTNAALQRLAQARRAAADLQIQFTSASNATDRAVMADTDAASVGFAREAEAARQAVHTDVAALRPLLSGLGYSEEAQALETFDKQLARYEQLDRQILQLAVENTNLKAQQLSFGEGQASADAFARAVGAVKAASPARRWEAAATAAAAAAAVRRIEVLQAPHIAAPEDASMSSLEAEMKTEEANARRGLAALSGLADAGSRQQLAGATGALNRFLEVNAQIIALSRKNTNVRSLALALNQKQKLAVPCVESLHALNDALAQRGYPKGRWE